MIRQFRDRVLLRPEQAPAPTGTGVGGTAASDLLTMASADTGGRVTQLPQRPGTGGTWPGTGGTWPGGRELPEVEAYRVRLDWERRYVQAVFLVDALAILLSTLVSFSVNFLDEGQRYSPSRFTAITLGLAVGWMLSMALGRTYEARFLGLGSDEFKRVFNAAVRLIAVIATVSYASHSLVGRRYVVIALPLATVLDLLGRYAARRVLSRLRQTGKCMHRVVVVGNREGATDLIRTAERADYAGMQVVGACLDSPHRAGPTLYSSVPVLGDLQVDTVLAAIRAKQATTVAVTACEEMNAPALRRLSWALEGTDVSLVVAPALTDIAGPRIHVRPVAGLPLLHIEEPQLSGGRRLVKGVFDRLLALGAVLFLLPAMAALALAVRMTSTGPALFRQVRVGKAGRPFTIYKYRSMRVDAESELEVLMAHNENSDGLLFKIRRDPRITSVGRWLRRYSLDELPQLLNIIKGDMSLVGPRPPLPTEVEQYETDVRRRLLVKPGLTGLWQVSGRSDLSWEEAVRLDLHYVENWSLALDFMILWKTVFAVMKGSGAY